MSIFTKKEKEEYCAIIRAFVKEDPENPDKKIANVKIGGDEEEIATMLSTIVEALLKKGMDKALISAAILMGLCGAGELGPKDIFMCLPKGVRRKMNKYEKDYDEDDDDLFKTISRINRFYRNEE